MQLVTIKLADLKSKDNPRADYSGVDFLAASIGEIGLLHPIVVKKVGTEFHIVDGESRLRALRKLGQTTVQAVVVDLGDEKTGEAAIMANVCRSGLNILELGRGWAALIATFPARYNVETIAKRFAVPAAKVKRFIMISKGIQPALHASVAPLLSHLDMEDLEMFAVIPGVENQEKVINFLVKNPGVSFWAALHSLFKRLDFTDAFGYEKAKQCPDRCFTVKNAGLETVWTTDSKFYRQCKTEFEKANPKVSKPYGQSEVEREETHVEKTEKEKKAEAVKHEKQKKARESAKMALRLKLPDFLKKKPASINVQGLGKKLVIDSLDADACKRLWTIFQVAGVDKYGAYELREKTWERILSKMVLNAEGLVQLHAFLSINRMPSSERSVEELWVKGLAI